MCIGGVNYGNGIIVRSKKTLPQHQPSSSRRYRFFLSDHPPDISFLPQIILPIQSSSSKHPPQSIPPCCNLRSESQLPATSLIHSGAMFFRERLPEGEQQFRKALKILEKNFPKPDNSDQQWLDRYFEEKFRGQAILQRRRRLMQLQSTGANKTHLDDAHQEAPPEYSAVCGLSDAEIAQEIQTLMRAFWKNNRKLFYMIEECPQTRRAQRVNLYRYHKDQNGRPFAWVGGRMICADSGGCCGRECRCCEKPLLQYDRPADYWEPTMKDVGVYGHCTSECPCCIAIKNEYTPHPNLPPTKLLLENN